MNLAQLKKIRVGISLLFFVLIFFLFLDFNSLFSAKFTNTVLYLQFAPSLLKFLALLSAAAIGFALIMVLSLFFGRIYCSTICPLGTFQDLISWFSRKIARKKSKKRKKPFLYSRPHNIIRYGILGLTILVLLSGSAFLLNLLDPFSNFGRIVTNLFKPVYMGANNLAVTVLGWFDNYSLYPVEMRTLGFASLFFPVVILITILVLAAWRGRLYCNTLCPVGTFLGVISRFSRYKIAISDDCNSCGLCEWNCKSECIDRDKKVVDMSRCVGCFNCFTVCNRQAMKFTKTSFSPNLSPKKLKVSELATDQTKRNFLISGLIAWAGLSGFKIRRDSLANKTDDPVKKIVATKASTVPENKKYPVTPPGSYGLMQYNDRCTACHLCVSACPTNVLQPAWLEYGLVGLWQPRMDYHSNFCNYDCQVCTDICPSGALLPMLIEDKKLKQLGKAKFILENCIVETENTDCGACSEHCPTKAVDMVPVAGKDLFIPEVTDSLCIGCGACEYACPTIPYKAIYVEGNPVHLRAKKPKEEKLDTEVDYEEDFPF